MFLAPTAAGLPPFSYLLDDLPAAPRAVARHLGVSWRTMQRWIKDDQAPRAAMLALFYESRWGRSAVDAAAVNDARQANALAGALERECAMLRARIARLERLGGYGSANAPIFDSVKERQAAPRSARPRIRRAAGAAGRSADGP